METGPRAHRTRRRRSAQKTSVVLPMPSELQLRRVGSCQHGMKLRLESRETSGGLDSVLVLLHCGDHGIDYLGLGFAKRPGIAHTRCCFVSAAAELSCD